MTCQTIVAVWREERVEEELRPVIVVFVIVNLFETKEEEIRSIKERETLRFVMSVVWVLISVNVKRNESPATISCLLDSSWMTKQEAKIIGEKERENEKGTYWGGCEFGIVVLERESESIIDIEMSLILCSLMIIDKRFVIQ